MPLPGDKHRQTHKTFAASDPKTLMYLPDMEVRYRLLRNEWLNLSSRYKQQDEYVGQAERLFAKGRLTVGEVLEARKRRAELATELGIMRRLALLGQHKSNAEAFQLVVERLLEKEDKIRVQEWVEDIVGRASHEMTRGNGQSATTAEDYKLFDQMMSRWDPLGKREDTNKA